MRACTYSGHGKAPRLTMQDKPPAPGEGQIKVKVHAAALNPIDHVTHAGTHKMLFSFQWPRTFGFDFAGVVTEVGAGVDGLGVGDKVFGMIAGLPHKNTGSMAEEMLVSSKYAVRIPENVSFNEAASIPLVAITCVKALQLCGLRPVDPLHDGTSSQGVATNLEENSTTNLGENKEGPHARGPRILITGGAGGVGTMGIQLAKTLFGASFVARG